MAARLKREEGVGRGIASEASLLGLYRAVHSCVLTRTALMSSTQKDTVTLD